MYRILHIPTGYFVSIYQDSESFSYEPNLNKTADYYTVIKTKQKRVIQTYLRRLEKSRFSFLLLNHDEWVRVPVEMSEFEVVNSDV